MTIHKEKASVISTDFIREYTKYVSRSRVLPHLDGLKPVQRRIMYSLLSLNARFNQGFKKTARVTGECMGRFHPHGDCLHPDTPIYSLDGRIRSIKELVGEELETISFNQKEKKVRRTISNNFRVGQITNEYIKITLNNKYILKVTKNHLIEILEKFSKRQQNSRFSIIPDARVSFLEAEHIKVGQIVNTSKITGCSLNNFFHRGVGLHHLNIDEEYNFISHHNNEIVEDNSRSNLKLVTRSEHAKIHGKENIKKNHKLIHNQNTIQGKRKKVRDKVLMSLFNKHQNLMKFFQICDFLKRNKLSLIEKNYNDYRKLSKIYNPPILKNLFKRYKKTFSDLINLYKEYCDSVNKLRFICNTLENESDYPFDNFESYYKSEGLEVKSTPSLKLPYNLPSWGVNIEKYYSNGSKYLLDGFDIKDQEILDKIECNCYSLVVTSVELIKEKDPIPFYDFTNLDTESMFIPLNKDLNNLTLISVHNSSISAAVANLVNAPNPLVNGRGNWGNIMGDPPAAERYTECQTSELFEKIFDPFTLKIGNFVPNYDESDFEPEILHSIIPFAPILGVSGIGIGFTTNFPVLSFESLKSQLFHLIDSTNSKKEEYGYGGYLEGSSVLPKYRITTRNRKKYLEIYEIPKKGSLAILRSSKLLHELQSSKQIEIINETNFRKTSLLIHAPDNIIRLIIKSISVRVIENPFYFYKKLRISNYLPEWLESRTEFIRRRECYIQTQEFNSNLIKIVMGEIHKHLENSPVTKFTNMAIKISKRFYQDNVKAIPDEAKEFLISEKNFVSKILSKPLSTLKPFNKKLNLTIPQLTKMEINNIIVDEINSLDIKLFSPSTSTLPSNLKVSITKTPLKRYIVVRPYGVEIKYRSIPRVLNWETEGEIILILNNGETFSINKTDFGLFEEIDGIRIIGFTYPKELTVFVTESRKIFAYKRLGVVKEPISQAFPASKLLVDNNEVILHSSYYCENYNSLKILEQ